MCEKRGKGERIDDDGLEIKRRDGMDGVVKQS